MVLSLIVGKFQMSQQSLSIGLTSQWSVQRPTVTAFYAVGHKNRATLFFNIIPVFLGVL